MRRGGQGQNGTEKLDGPEEESSGQAVNIPSSHLVVNLGTKPTGRAPLPHEPECESVTCQALWRSEDQFSSGLCPTSSVHKSQGRGIFGKGPGSSLYLRLLSQEASWLQGQQPELKEKIVYLSFWLEKPVKRSAPDSCPRAPGEASPAGVLLGVGFHSWCLSLHYVNGTTITNCVFPQECTLTLSKDQVSTPNKVSSQEKLLLSPPNSECLFFPWKQREASSTLYLASSMTLEINNSAFLPHHLYCLHF